MRVEHRLILRAGARNLGVELTEGLEVSQHSEERLVAVHLRAPALFREGHKNSPEKELQETQRPHATTPGFARRTSIFYSIRKCRIHGDSSVSLHRSVRTRPNRVAVRFRIPCASGLNNRLTRAARVSGTVKKDIFMCAKPSSARIEISVAPADNGRVPVAARLSRTLHRSVESTGAAHE
jgi:hypothetical protein